MQRYGQGRLNDDGSFTMICTICEGAIEGSISSELFAIALDFNRSRNGIQCPDCRASTCQSCGGSSEYINHDGVCIICDAPESDKNLSAALIALRFFNSDTTLGDLR